MEFKDPIGAHRTAGIPVIGASWTDMEIDREDVAGMVFHDCVLERVRLRGASLWQTMFVNCRLDDCEFIDCRLFRTQWVGCSGSRLRIVGGEFSEAVFSDCRFERLDVERAGERVVFGQSEFGRVSFNGDGCAQRALTISDCSFGEVAAENATWESIAAVGLDLGSWSLSGAKFDRCMFVEAAASGLDLSDVRFESCNLYHGRFDTARIRHAQGTIFAECDCDDADFIGAELEGALFSKATARRGRFQGAKLTNAMFPGSTLTAADFSGSQATSSAWVGADLSSANLERMDAYRASFRNVVFKDTRVDGARFEEADLHGVEESLIGANLTGARGTVQWRAQVEKQARQTPQR